MSQRDGSFRTWRSTSRTTSWYGNDPPTTPADVGWNAIVEKADKFIRHGFYGVDQTRKSKGLYTGGTLPRVMGRRPNGDDAAAVQTDRTAVRWVDQLEVLARLAGVEETDPYKIARATFESIAGGGDRKDKFLHDGLADSASNSVFADFDASAASAAWKEVP